MAQFYFLGNSTTIQMFGCVIITEHKTVVIDGGTVGDAPQLEQFLRTHRPPASAWTEDDPIHVDLWLFTHPHHDHFGAFLTLCENTTALTVEQICCHFPSNEDLRRYEGRNEAEIRLWDLFDALAAKRFAARVHTNEVGDVFQADDITAEVLRVYNPAFTANFVNNSSTVYKITGEHASVLILGDLGVEGGEELMRMYPEEITVTKEDGTQEKRHPRAVLFTDYTQMAHHGQRGVSRACYEYLSPRACLWAAPDWLWDNDRGTGFDCGPWETVRTREWMDALGVTTHLVEKDGTQSFEI